MMAVHRLNWTKSGIDLEGEAPFAIVRYSYHFQVGSNEHKISLYRKYTNEKGAEDIAMQFTSVRKDDLLKAVKRYLTPQQYWAIRDLAKERTNGFVDTKGNYHRT